MAHEETPAQLVKRLTDAVCGWLTFHQAAHHQEMYSEHLVYLPIYEVAAGRGWKVFPQFAVRPRVPRPGAPHSIDFLFFYEATPAFAALEIKFLKRGAVGPTNPLTYDVGKLMRVDHDVIASEMPVLKPHCQKNVPLDRFMMTIGQRSNIHATWNRRREHEKLKRQVNYIWEKADTKSHTMQVSTKRGWFRASPAIIKHDFRVLTLRQQGAWSSIEIE